MYIITGATGLLGHKVLNHLLNLGVPATEITALARTPEKLKDFSDKGINVKKADYNDLDSLKNAFSEGAKLLLISSSEVGQRATQHKNVIDAAKAKGVGFITYTSLLKADQSPLGLAPEHKITEEFLRDSGLTYNILRNGWYAENYTGSIASVLEHKTLFGCAGEAKIAAATRDDYALAAAKNLLSPAASGKIYELAGDVAFTLSEYAAKIGEVTGQKIAYENLSTEGYEKLLTDVGVPAPLPTILAQTEELAQDGWLDNQGHDLSNLIGRKTTSIEDAIKQAL